MERPAVQGAHRRKAYLLTCWQEPDEEAGSVIWRLRLETSRSDRQHILASLEEVMTTIEAELFGDTVAG